MANLKTTTLGVLQLLLVAAFVVSKFRTGAAFTDAEVALVTSMFLSGAKGIAAADAKSSDK